MLSKITQIQKVKDCMFSFLCGSWRGKMKKKGSGSHKNQREITKVKGRDQREEKRSIGE